MKQTMIALCVMALLAAPALAAASAPAPAAAANLDFSPLPGTGDLAAAFLKHYKPVAEDFKIQMPAYDLPLDKAKVTNFDSVAGPYLKDPKDLERLMKNGFAVVRGGQIEDITAPYAWFRQQNLPMYVTADTLLHLFHVQFDETLKDIEEAVFYPDIVAVTKAMLAASEADYASLDGDLKEAARRNVAYFAVALSQLEPEYKAPDYVKEVVAWECEHIEKHAGFTQDEEARAHALFRFSEDYSQYLPRGHYTRSETLKKYFRGMMWYGRMTFLAKGHEKFGPFIPPAKALTDRDTARIQTLGAALISAHAGSVKLPDGRPVAAAWDRMYAVTAFYVGFADDLTLYEYREAFGKVMGEKAPPAALTKQADYAKVLLELVKLRKPAIFSGTGNAGVRVDLVPGGEVTTKQLDDILDATQGFRFMGQRYIPDSYMFGQLVFPASGTGGAANAFTTVVIRQVGPVRGFPRGLDVFSVLGSKRAETHLAALKDTDANKYAPQIEKLRKEFGDLKPADWNRNLYWSWLYSLKTLAEPCGKGYQTYQQSDAWTDRQLNTALASWASLRHDTILYAKQSYTPRGAGTAPGGHQPPPPPKGLVEPLPAFYARMLTTARMARDGLAELKVTTPPAVRRMDALVSTLEHLLDLCKRQVANEALTAAGQRVPQQLPGDAQRYNRRGRLAGPQDHPHRRRPHRLELRESAGGGVRVRRLHRRGLPPGRGRRGAGHRAGPLVLRVQAPHGRPPDR